MINKNKNLVSVVMSTYNDSAFIRTAIKGVKEQSYEKWELIIVNDGSTDNTSQIIKELGGKDKRIKYYKNRKNKGIVYSLNKGIRLAKGEFISRLDGDDEWIDRNKLKVQIEYLNKNKNVVLVGTWAYKTNPKGQILQRLHYPISDKKIRSYLMVENCFVNSTVVIRKSHLEKTNPYDPEFVYALDYGLWMKLGTRGKMHNIPKYTANYRMNPNGVTAKKYDQQIKNTFLIIKKYKDNYPNFTIGLILLYSRKFINRNIREFISNNFRKIIMHH